MIWNIIVNIIAGALQIILNFLPSADGAILTFISSGVSTINGYLYDISWIFPSATLVIMLKAIMGFELFMVSLRIFMWLASHLPFINNRI